MWTTDSRWFDVAVFATLHAALTTVFGHFEQHKPAWRRLLKLALPLALLLVLIETVGRAGAYSVLGLLLLAGGTVHFAVLSRVGVNGWTGEPRDKFEALLREIQSEGEWRTFVRLTTSTRRSSP